MRRLSLVALLLVLLPRTALAWNPPVGVPVPPWPASLDIGRPNLPSPWSGERAGFYYIAPTACSNSRTYGYPAAPRCSMPSSPAAGAVIALDGTISGALTISFAGNAENPIWIMGYNPTTKPSVTHYWTITGSYLVLDSLAFDLSARDGIDLVGHHIMVRGSTLANPYASANGAGFGIGGQHIVFYNNVISQMGNWQYQGPDLDRVGIKVFGGAADIWIVDSVFYHCQSDGLTIGDATNTAAQVNRVYVGRNRAYENLQFGFWTKNATDVIFSENVSYSHRRTTDSGPGGGLGGQYDPKYVWFLNNVVVDNNSGIHAAGTSSGGGGPWYAIGNLIYAVSAGGACNGYDFGALSYRNDGGFTVLFNTVYDVDFFGGYPPSGGGVTIRNNIFASKKSNSCQPFESERTLTHDYNLYSSASYDPGGEAHRVVGDPRFVAPAAPFALQPTSPAINSANPSQEAAFATFQARYGIDISRDFSGTPRPQARWDIGAFEFVGSGAFIAAPTNIRIVP